MNFLLQKPDWKAMIVSTVVMIGRKWSPGFLRAVKIVTPLLIVGTLKWSSEQHEPIGHKQEGQKSTVTLPIYIEIGQASWYGPGFHGQETASGETFDTNKMTAAHPSLPLGTKVEVINLEKQKKAEVTINDRGPFVKGRVIDLSHAAAKKLGMAKKGTAKVKIVTKAVKKKIPRKKSSQKRSSGKKHKSAVPR
jgi:rare lipoprotein A (peptidoglycan hydrolase)